MKTCFYLVLLACILACQGATTKAPTSKPTSKPTTGTTKAPTSSIQPVLVTLNMTVPAAVLTALRNSGQYISGCPDANIIGLDLYSDCFEDTLLETARDVAADINSVLVSKIQDTGGSVTEVDRLIIDDAAGTVDALCIFGVYWSNIGDFANVLRDGAFETALEDAFAEEWFGPGNITDFTLMVDLDSVESSSNHRYGFAAVFIALVAGCFSL